MDGITEIINCGICAKMLTDPRMLPCIHTFCLKCLQEKESKTFQELQERMTCPVCKEEFSIPPEGMKGLQKSFFMERVVEIAKVDLSSPAEEVIECEVCVDTFGEGAEKMHTPPAISYCLQCHQNICSHCCQIHGLIQDLKDHQLVKLGSQVKEDVIRKCDINYCEQHDKEKVKMFCRDCMEVICMICFAEDHQIHKCLDIEKVAQEFRQTMHRDMEGIKVCSKEASTKSEQLLKEKSDFINRVEMEKRRVIDRGMEIKSQVEKSTRSLLNELAVLQQKGLKEADNEIDEAERHKMIMKSFNAYCTELKSKGSGVDVCLAIGDLHSTEAEDLRKIHQEQIQRKTNAIPLSSFKPSDLEFLKSRNIVGAITDNVHLVNRLHLPSVSSSVWGVTALNDNIYVVCRIPSSVFVFQGRGPFKFKKEIQMEYDSLPSDIESSEITQCLYVSDVCSHCVWQIETYYYSLTKWLSPVHGPMTLSISSDGHLLILRENKWFDELEIYNITDATLIRRIPLAGEIRYPLHVLQQPNGQFIISHSLGGMDGPWTVSQLNSDGQIIRQLKPKKKKVPTATLR